MPAEPSADGISRHRESALETTFRPVRLTAAGERRTLYRPEFCLSTRFSWSVTIWCEDQFQTAKFIPRSLGNLTLEDDDQVAGGVPTIHHPGARAMVAGNKQQSARHLVEGLRAGCKLRFSNINSALDPVTKHTRGGRHTGYITWLQSVDVIEHCICARRSVAVKIYCAGSVTAGLIPERNTAEASHLPRHLRCGPRVDASDDFVSQAAPASDPVETFRRFLHRIGHYRSVNPCCSYGQMQRRCPRHNDGTCVGCRRRGGCW
jgi:hypothetical protein